MRDLKVDNLENLTINFMSGSKGKDKIRKSFQTFDQGSFALWCQFTQIGNIGKKQGGDEDEFNFGCIVFEGSLVHLRRVVCIDSWI